jgi:hypothetical protein
MANTVSRYHLSHSPDVAGVCPLSEQRIQAPRDFNRDAPGREGVPENCYGLNKPSDRLSRVKPLAAAKSVNRRIAEERSETETRSCHWA